MKQGPVLRIDIVADSSVPKNRGTFWINCQNVAFIPVQIFHAVRFESGCGNLCRRLSNDSFSIDSVEC
jgi:hypothetical protein